VALLGLVQFFSRFNSPIKFGASLAVFGKKKQLQVKWKESQSHQNFQRELRENIKQTVKLSPYKLITA
jgi:hypothetical protein